MKKLIIILGCFIGLLTSCSSYRYHSLIQDERIEDHRAFYKNFAVSSGGRESSRIAKQIKLAGGSLIDAAVAMSFALGVERPQSTGIGGGGFLLYHEAGQEKPIAWDFREIAPIKAHKDMYLDKQGNEISRLSVDGAKAVAVPGLVHGLLKMHAKWGKLPLKQVLAPVEQLAREGFKVYPHLANAIKRKQELLKKFNGDVFFRPDGTPLQAGDRLVQVKLADTIKLIGEKGIEGFYSPKNISYILKALGKNGIIQKRDFKRYQVKDRAPVYTHLGDHKVFSMPPPSSGGVHVLQILNTLDALGPNRRGAFQSTTSYHHLSTAMQIAFADRATYLGDPDFFPVPTKHLTSKQYAKQLGRLIPPNKALAAKEMPYKAVLKRGMANQPQESTETTHFSMMDGEGNTLASTQTINGFFGSGIYVPELGIMLNNEMDDFATKVGASNIYGAIGGKPNLVEPGKRPLSSMSPTIVLDQNGIGELSIGSPSGTRIITCVAQSMANIYFYKQDLYQAISAARIHQQWMPDKLFVEKDLVTTKTQRELSSYGHQVVAKDLGCRVQGIMRKDGQLEAVSDPRQYGQVAGF